MSDGLSILDQQRERRTRRIPKSRNPPRDKPAVTPQTHASESKPVDSKPEEVATPNTGTAPESLKVSQPTVKMSIYLEPEDDLYIEEIAHAGKRSRPRVAISRSAIVRLALERLGETMATEEIVKALRQRGEQHQGAGRKRR